MPESGNDRTRTNKWNKKNEKKWKERKSCAISNFLWWLCVIWFSQIVFGCLLFIICCYIVLYIQYDIVFLLFLLRRHCGCGWHTPSSSSSMEWHSVFINKLLLMCVNYYRYVPCETIPFACTFLFILFDFVCKRAVN